MQSLQVYREGNKNVREGVGELPQRLRTLATLPEAGLVFYTHMMATNHL